MDRFPLISRILTGAWIMLALTLVHAGTPALLTFTPLTPTTLTVSTNSTATVSYQVMNQSHTPHTLLMNIIPGITQVTTSGYCPNPFVLGYRQSCILNLVINGGALSGNVSGGPIVCEHGNPNECYQPSSAESLHITRVIAQYYAVGGYVYGLLGTLVLANNGDNYLTRIADGIFAFSQTLPTGSPYAVTVASQPSTQTCTVNNGTGVITNSNVNNILVTCSTNTRTVGGTVSGLASSESLVLQNNGGDNLTVTSNGGFTFTTPVAQGSSYQVTILTQPTTQTCTVTNGTGTVGSSNITNVQVTCATNAYTVGGTVSGLFGTVVLQNNSTDSLSISNNGSFNFPTPVAQGATYQVTVLTQPTNQTCIVTNGSGTMGNSNVTNVAVNCITSITTLSASVSALALSVTGFTEYGVSGTPSSGLPRIITITNTGSFPAVNLAVTTPTWPSGTTSTTSCGNVLTAGNSCTITITPGNTASSNGTNPCSNGTAPIPGVVIVSANNTNSVSTEVVVLSYACLYQGGYVYAFDDTTPNTGSVGGKTLTQTTNGSLIWSSNGTGSAPADVANDSIYGISDTSTTSSANPSSGQEPGQTACNGATDGICDTNNIYVYYQNFSSGAPVNLSYYAAGACKQTINSYSDWYLPSVCELGYDTNNYGSGCGTSSTPTLQNVQSSFIDIQNFLLISGTFYWSSTESSGSPTYQSWYQYLYYNGFQGKNYKDNQYRVACSRILTY